MNPLHPRARLTRPGGPEGLFSVELGPRRDRLRDEGSGYSFFKAFFFGVLLGCWVLVASLSAHCAS